MTVIAVASDHGGFHLKEIVKDHLRRKGHRVLDFGCNSPESVDWPEMIYPAAAAVSTGEAEIGILMDGGGFSSGMLANRLPGVRAAVCWHTTSAKVAREHCGANVLCVGGKMIETNAALEIVDTFLESQFSEEERYMRRMAQFEAYARRHQAVYFGAASTSVRQTITAEDVIRLASTGRIFEPGPNDILTPEARDLLAKLRANLKS